MYVSQVVTVIPLNKILDLLKNELGRDYTNIFFHIHSLDKLLYLMFFLCISC